MIAPPIRNPVLAVPYILSEIIFCLIRYSLVISDIAMIATNFTPSSTSNFLRDGGLIFIDDFPIIVKLTAS